MILHFFVRKEEKLWKDFGKSSFELLPKEHFAFRDASIDPLKQFPKPYPDDTSSLLF